MVSAMASAHSAEARLKELGITLPAAPSPLGAYVPAVQSGKLLFLSGMIPIAEGKPIMTGRVGDDLDMEQGRAAARAACLNGLAVARQHLGSLDRITRVVRVGAAIVTSDDFVDHPRLADAASTLLEEVFGKDKTSTRILMGVSSLPLGLPLELELIFEVQD
ncbi:MAG: RidA family protein [Burkholderiaceae bacterium]|nr:RidA family protein [Burkholderiaceae bacterium]